MAPDEAYKDGEEKVGKPLRPLRVIQDLDSYSTVFMPGESPCFIIKSASTPPFLIRMRCGPIRSLSRLDIPKYEKGFIFIDEEVGVLIQHRIFTFKIDSDRGLYMQPNCHRRAAIAPDG